MLFFEVLKIHRSRIPHKHTTSKNWRYIYSFFTPQIYLQKKLKKHSTAWTDLTPGNYQNNQINTCCYFPEYANSLFPGDQTVNW